MIKIKDGVDVVGLHINMWKAIYQIKEIFDDLEVDLVITSALDGTHSRGSLHYAGMAVDLRTRNLKDVKGVFKSIKATLPDAYDVVLESNHFHLEYQPKTPLEILYYNRS